MVPVCASVHALARVRVNAREYVCAHVRVYVRACERVCAELLLDLKGSDWTQKIDWIYIVETGSKRQVSVKLLKRLQV